MMSSAHWAGAHSARGKLPLPKTPSAFRANELHLLGVGALYVRRRVRFSPFLVGGHQEDSRHGGTEAVALIVALDKAAELAHDRLAAEQTRVRALRDRLENGLLDRCLDARLNGHPQCRLPNTTNISFQYVEGEAILLMLDQHGICASSGSACTTGSLEPSHVLRRGQLRDSHRAEPCQSRRGHAERCASGCSLWVQGGILVFSQQG